MIDLDLDFGLLFLNRTISVPFELEWGGGGGVGMLIPGLPLPEKYQKECGISYSSRIPKF